MRNRLVLGFLIIPLLFVPSLLAQTAPSNQDARLAKLEATAADAKSSADNAWMLTSSALVLMMTGPGLALFYGGLVRKKNVLATMVQSFSMMAVITILWALVSYSLAFGAGNSFIGGLHHVFLHGVGAQPDADYAATIPLQTFMVYQLMFAIITPALITGAFAERMKFSAMLLFMVLWSLLVYSPMAHMVWGKGGLLNASLGGRFPCLDFAGGTVVHVTSGVSALVCALYLGKRVGYPKDSMTPHSVVLSFVGACLLWVGWFGFNAGFGYDDSLDAFGVHGAGGTLGALLTGVFAASSINPIFKDSQGAALASGLMDGHPGQVLNQAIGVAIAWVLAILGTLLILKIVDAMVGLRVPKEEEVQGLDLTQHGEEGYSFEVTA